MESEELKHGCFCLWGGVGEIICVRLSKDIRIENDEAVLKRKEMF